MIDWDVVIAGSEKCSSCDGRGYYGTGTSIQQCSCCGGNGKIITHITLEAFKNEMFEELVKEISKGDYFSSSLIYSLINESKFVDMLLEKVGHKMGEQEDA